MLGRPSALRGSFHIALKTARCDLKSPSLWRHFPAASFSTDNKKGKKRRYTFVPAGPVDLDALNKRIRDFEAQENVVKAEIDLAGEAARVGVSVDEYDQLRKHRETLGRIQDMSRDSLRDRDLHPELFDDEEEEARANDGEADLPELEQDQIDQEREDLEREAAETPYAYAMQLKRIEGLEKRREELAERYEAIVQEIYQAQVAFNENPIVQEKVKQGDLLAPYREADDLKYNQGKEFLQPLAKTAPDGSQFIDADDIRAAQFRGLTVDMREPAERSLAEIQEMYDREVPIDALLDMPKHADPNQSVDPDPHLPFKNRPKGRTGTPQPSKEQLDELSDIIIELKKLDSQIPKEENSAKGKGAAQGTVEEAEDEEGEEGEEGDEADQKAMDELLLHWATRWQGEVRNDKEFDMNLLPPELRNPFDPWIRAHRRRIPVAKWDEVSDEGRFEYGWMITDRPWLLGRPQPPGMRYTLKQLERRLFWHRPVPRDPETGEELPDPDREASENGFYDADQMDAWYRAYDEVLDRLPHACLTNLLTTVQQWNIYQEYLRQTRTLKQDPETVIQNMCQVTGLTKDRIRAVLKLLEIHDIAQKIGFPEDTRKDSYSMLMDSAFPPMIETEFLFRKEAGGGFDEEEMWSAADPDDTYPVSEYAAGHAAGFEMIDPDEDHQEFGRQLASQKLKPLREYIGRLAEHEFVSDPQSYDELEPRSSKPPQHRTTVFIDLDDEDVNLRIREPDGVLRTASLAERKGYLRHYGLAKRKAAIKKKDPNVRWNRHF